MSSFAARRRRRRVVRAQAREVRDRLPPILGERAEVPSVVVHGPDGEWVLHGIAHGQRRAMRLSPEVRALLVGAVEGWIAVGDEVGLEPGLTKILGIDDALALDAGNPLQLLAPREVVSVVASVLTMLALLPIAPLATRLSRDPEWPYLRAALRDPRALVPLTRAHELLRPTDETEALAPTSGERFRRAYSGAMAEAARAAREDTGARFHLVVGLAHVPDLVHLLRA